MAILIAIAFSVAVVLIAASVAMGVEGLKWIARRRCGEDLGARSS
jgi:hypothetical protein